MIKILILVFVAVFAVSVNAQSDKEKTAIEVSIKAVMDKQVEAWNRGDIDGFMEGYWKSENLRFVSGNSVANGWQAALDRYKKGYDSPDKMGTLSFSELEFTVLDKKAAFVKGRFTLVRKADKPTGLFTLVFRKIDGEWKVVHDHTST